MSFAEEFRHDREELKKKLLTSSNILLAQEAILTDIVLKEFKRWHKLAPAATHVRVTFHSGNWECVTYNTRLNGEYNVKDPVANEATKELMSAAVLLVEICKDDPMEAWADGISAREEYDAENEMWVYTFEFFG